MEVQEREAILVRDLAMSLEATLSHLPPWCVCVGCGGGFAGRDLLSLPQGSPGALYPFQALVTWAASPPTCPIQTFHVNSASKWMPSSGQVPQQTRDPSGLSSIL